MELFVVNNLDFTQHIKVPSYKVNREDVYEEWEDSNYSTHREVTRKRVSGSFTLIYDDITELDTFFDTIEVEKTVSGDGSVPMTVYLNKQHETADIIAFINYTPANEKPIFGVEKVNGFEVTIKEK